MRGRWRVPITLLAVAALSMDGSPGAAPVAAASPAAVGVVDLDAGSNHNCVVLDTGAITCWGAMTDQQKAVPAGSFTKLDTSWYHTCGIRPNASLTCWGTNYYGQVVQPAGTYTAVSTGAGQTCAIRTDGTLACWGLSATPPAGTFTDIGAEGGHACAVRTDGTVACWGYPNYYGEADAPAGTFSDVATGRYRSCGVRTDGTLHCWGGGATPPAGTYTAVSADDDLSCALATDGTLACWGGPNWYGELTPPAGTFVEVSVGSQHACARTSDGSLTCWGINDRGQGTPVVVAPDSLAFGSEYAGSTTPGSSLVITNLGGVAATVSSVSIGGADAADFAVVSEGCTTAAIGSLGSCAIEVAMTPGATGARSAALTISGPAPVGTREIALAGTGLDPITVTPSSVAFGNVVKDTADTPETVTVGNLGDVPVDVEAVSLSGADATDFSIASESCTAAPVPAAGSCTISVGFQPSAYGERAATLEVTGPSPVDTRSVPLTGTGVRAPSGVSWGTRYNAGPAYTWNSGNVLGRTVQSGSQRLHLAYATNRIGSRWAKDAGPYMGVYYVRSTTGSSWSAPKRLNSSRQHAERPGLAAAGSRVYVTWVSQTKLYKYSPTAPRALYIRVNTRHGASTAWKSAVRLTSGSGRVDYPTVAASGDDVHVAYTDANTGAVKVATSGDRGATWTRRSVGATTRATSDGKAGWPMVAVAGSTVAVAWVADSAGTVKLAVSANRGSTWEPPLEVSPQSNGDLSVAVRGTRIAVAWTTDDAVVVRQRTDATWGDPVVVAVLEWTPDDPILFAPVVALQDPDRIAVAWADGPVGDDTGYADLRWAESANGGQVWYATQTLATPASSRRLNDWASVLWPSAGTRYVAWNGWTQYSSSYRQYIRKGTGTPVGPTTAAVVWQPADAGVTVWNGSSHRPGALGGLGRLK